MRRRWHASLIALVLPLVACWKTHDPLSVEIRDAPNGASGQAGHGGGGMSGAKGTTHRALADAGRSSSAQDGGIVEPVASSTERAPDGPDSAAAAADAVVNARTEIWIGELWSADNGTLCPWPWPSSGLVVQPVGYIDRVVLILEHVGSAELRGRIQLGEGVVPTSPGNSPYVQNDPLWICSIQLPTSGAEYTLLDPVLTSNRLMFEISASEVWDSWCQTQSSPCPGAPAPICPDVCACEAGACKAAPHDQVPFDLAVTTDTIEGQLPFGGGYGTRAELRLRRVQ
jgi:hypothetical protein